MEGQVGKVDHSTAGALHTWRHLRDHNPAAGRILAYCIAGHHAGLADWDGQSNACLRRRLSVEKPETLDALIRAPRKHLDQPLPSMPGLQPGPDPAFQVSFFVRMLFSCLTDADFLDTEQYMAPGRAAERNVPIPTTAQLADALRRHLADIQSRAEPTDVNRHRHDILTSCLAAAELEPGIFSLTVPTGGGKTLSSLAFALGHARRFDLRRVVYAVPFTSIIEQNAAAFRKALGGLAAVSVLEHHSNLEPRRETPWSRLTSENWDAPLVVTTNVQLLESLFANRTSRCRKLHNLARSVIILDEAQALPVELLAPSLAALRELVRNYGCTVVLCTATQPAIHHREDFPIGLQDVREITPDPRRLYMQMKRVRAEHIGLLPNSKLVARLGVERQVLCIVNTKRHARDLYLGLPRDGSTFHLSALMCPRHRTAVLRLVKRRLDTKRSCRLISTQLVEAGVDIDFPAVYRAMSGLDSIAQAAGRCNREGRTATGRVFVFDTSQPPPPGHLRQSAQTAHELIGLHDDLLGLDAIERFFQLHYWKRQDAWDQYNVMGCFSLSQRGEPMSNFRQAADAFHLIRDETRPLIIPWGFQGRALVTRLRRSPLPDRGTRRALQRYTVQVRQRQWECLEAQNAIELVHEQYSVLVDSTRYSSDTGLSLDDGRLIPPERSII